ncbi:response regulator, partial [Flavobacterium sp. ANB]|uniref:response regulator n=1 Tax=Flavobacterium sp. ANB TaxID=2783790 RepID=UPI00188B4553
EDDRALLSDAIFEVDPSLVLKEAHDGMHLMEILDTLTGPLPEVIFLDINMPGKSGFDCLEEIRYHKGIINKLKIIMFSTSSDPGNIEKAQELGATFYAVKPSTFQDLKSLLQKILEIDLSTAQVNRKNFRLA